MDLTFFITFHVGKLRIIFESIITYSKKFSIDRCGLDYRYRTPDSCIRWVGADNAWRRWK